MERFGALFLPILMSLYSLVLGGSKKLEHFPLAAGMSTNAEIVPKANTTAPTLDVPHEVPETLFAKKIPTSVWINATRSRIYVETDPAFFADVLNPRDESELNDLQKDL